LTIAVIVFIVAGFYLKTLTSNLISPPADFYGTSRESFYF